jgi:hypothetical protein
MESGRTWVVKVRMSNPQLIPEVPITGPDVFTDEDVQRLHRRLRDDAPFDWQQRLINAVLEDGAIVAYFETSVEPSPEEAMRRELHRLTRIALLPYRRPSTFLIVKVFPPIEG